MRGRLALYAKVLRRLHQADPEKCLPSPVHRHPRRQRILRRNQPACEVEPVDAPAGLSISGTAAKQRRYRTDDLHVRLALIVAAIEHERLPPLLHLIHDHHPRDPGGGIVPLAHGRNVLLDQLRVSRIGLGGLEVRQRLQQAVDVPAPRLHLRVGRKKISGQLDRVGRFLDGPPLRPRKLLHLEGFHALRHLIDFRVRPLDALLLRGRRHVEDGRDLTTASGATRTAGLRQLIEDVIECIVVLLRNRVVLVIVTPGAGKREPEPHRRGRLDAVEHVLDSSLLGDPAALAVEHVVAVKPARELLRRRRIRQLITRQLFNRELVVRHVRVDRVHHPVSPRPHRALGIALKAIRVRVPRHIEPVPRPAFAIARRGQQPVDEPLVSVGRAVGEKRVQLGRRRRYTRQLEGHPPQQRLARRLGRRREVFPFQ